MVLWRENSAVVCVSDVSERLGQAGIGGGCCQPGVIGTVRRDAPENQEILYFFSHGVPDDVKFPNITEDWNKVGVSYLYSCWNIVEVLCWHQGHCALLELSEGQAIDIVRCDGPSQEDTKVLVAGDQLDFAPS